MINKNNPQLKKGYTKIANGLLEKFSKTSLSGSSWRVLMAIIRKIYGFNKKEDWISYKQLSEMTGMLKPNISQAISQLVSAGVVMRTHNGNKVIISLEKNYKPLSERITLRTVMSSTTNRYEKGKLTVMRKTRLTGSTKETITKDNLQKKYTHLEDVKEKDFQEISEKYKVPLAFVRSKYDDMELWVGEKSGRGRGRNWRLTLMNWVKRDSIKIRKESYDKKSAIDARAIISQKSQARI